MANNKSYTLKLGVGYDAAILGKLESVKNKSSYIKELIRKDIDGQLKPVTEFTKATEEKAEEYSNITEKKYKEQFDKGIHYFLLEMDEEIELRKMNGLNTATKLYLWTRKGSLMFTKIINNGVGWEQYKKLLDIRYSV